MLLRGYGIRVEYRITAPDRSFIWVKPKDTGSLSDWTCKVICYVGLNLAVLFIQHLVSRTSEDNTLLECCIIYRQEAYINVFFLYNTFLFRISWLVSSKMFLYYFEGLKCIWKRKNFTYLLTYLLTYEREREREREREKWRARSVSWSKPQKHITV